MKILAVTLFLLTALSFRVAGAPVTNAAPAASFYRSYQIDTNSFDSNLSRKFRINNQHPAILMSALTNYWHQKGIDISNLYYRPGKGILVFYATEKQHKRLAFLLAEFQPPKPILLGSNHRAALDAGSAVNVASKVSSPARVSADRSAKQRMRMFKSLLLIVGALGIGAPTFAQNTIKAGQTWTLGFNSIPYLGTAPYNPSMFGLVTVSFFTVPGGPATFTLDLFENTLLDPPLTFFLTWTNQYFLGASATNIWTDHQGWIRLHVVTGELKVASMNIDVYKYNFGNEQVYESTFYQPSLSEAPLTNSSGILQSTLQWPSLNVFQTSPNAVRYTLQSSLFCGSGSWSNVTNQPVVVGSLSSVTVDALGPQRFYRLINTNFSVMLQ